MENKLRTIVVGDIHGCIDEFAELLRILSYNKNSDRLILLGDLIDRGPDSVAVVRKAREMNLECVMGNHEAKFLRWFNSSKSGQEIHKNDHYNKLDDDDSNYIFHMPSYIKIDNTVIVHAGLRAGVPIDKQVKDDLLYIRYVDAEQKFISLKKISKLGKKETGALFWTQFWYGPESVVYGHNVHSTENPLIEKMDDDIVCYGIDTGCCFGGKLTALILETKEIVQVPAKAIYYQSRFNI